MVPTNRRILEVEVLEDRCTPAALAPETTAFNIVSFTPPNFVSVNTLPPTTPAANLIVDSGLVASTFFMPTPNGAESPILNAGNPMNNPLALNELPAMSPMLSVNGTVNPNNTVDLNGSGLIPPAGFGGIANGLGLQASPQALLSNQAGVPLTVPFALPSEFDNLPLYDRNAGVPSYVEFESFEPFVLDGMGRSSYEGNTDLVPPATPPAPQPTPMPTPYPYPSSAFVEPMEYV